MVNIHIMSVRSYFHKEGNLIPVIYVTAELIYKLI